MQNTQPQTPLGQLWNSMLKTHYGDKFAGHVSRDATAIHAREKPPSNRNLPWHE